VTATCPADSADSQRIDPSTLGEWECPVCGETLLAWFLWLEHHRLVHPNPVIQWIETEGAKA
jgi:hypothetical protein